MDAKREKRVPPESTLPKMSAMALKGKQSVRTSFKLSDACIHAISIVTTQLGIKHRSLFDYLVEDAESLETIAKEIVNRNHTPDGGIQKSYIISRGALSILDTKCQRLNISRDALIELSVRRLLPIIEKEIESQRRRKDMFELVQNHYQDTKTVMGRIKDTVGVEDPIYKAFQNTLTTCKLVRAQINDIIVKGKVMEEFDPDSLKDTP